MGNFFNSLNRKRVLVTGGARGIGKGIAKKCLEEGAKVFITNLDKRVGLATEKELSVLGEIKSLQCDSTDKAQVDSMVKGIWKSEGPLDLVFSNSGSGSQHRVLEANSKEIQKLLATNFESAVNIAQCCLPLMIQEQTDAHIMFTGSEHSVSLPKGNESLGFAYYGATKHAMLIMAEWLRHDLSDTNVSVSILIPGPVMTESVAHTFDMLAKEPENQQFRAIFSEEVESLLRERAITTEQCAEIALTGLRAQLFYIPTQKYIFSDIQNRYKEMETSFHRLFS